MSRPTTYYQVGSVRLVRSSVTVKGFGTSWLTDEGCGITKPQAGNLFTVDKANYYIIKSVDSDEQLTLERPYNELSAARTAYAVITHIISDPKKLKIDVAVIGARAVEAEKSAKKDADRAEQAQLVAVRAEVAAAASEVAAAQSEANAETSAINATNEAGKAKTSEDNAKVSEKNAKLSETNAKTSEVNAKASEDKAHDWAEETEDTPVVGTRVNAEFSSKHYAKKSAASSLQANNSRKLAEQAKNDAINAATRTSDAFVGRGSWNPSVTGLPPVPNTNSMWYVDSDSNGLVGGLNWTAGDYLVYDMKSAKFTQLTGQRAGTSKPTPVEFNDDILMQPGKAIRFKESPTDKDPMYAIGLHIPAPNSQRNEKRLIIGDVDEVQQSEVAIYTHDKDKVFIVEQIDKDPAADFEPVRRIPILHEDNGISKKKGGVAEDHISCTVEPTAPQHLTTKSYVDKGNKKIKDELLDEEWRIYAQTETDMQVIRERNLNQFAASGNVHMGTHHHNGSNIFSINEGLYSYTAEPNVLHMGRDAGVAKLGTSETPFPVTQIAGIISELVGINKGTVNTPSSVQIKFEDAPDGTEVYDSTGNARGLGKALLNLKQDIDPKYNNVAQDANEARARAFEGYIGNGNGRLGSASFPWSHEVGVTLDYKSDHVSASTNSISGNYFLSHMANNIPVGSNVEAIIHIECDHDSGLFVRVNDGANSVTGNGYHSDDPTLKANKPRTLRYKFKTKNTQDVRIGIGLRTVGANYKISFEVRPITEEVVINRVDMYGFEYFLEEVTKAQPHVYPKGCIQSKASTMNGIPTTVSNRPSTYFDVYPFDSNSDGKGVDFFALSTDDKKKILSDKSNNIFLLSDGRLVQWRVRQRTIKGLGNGDFFNTSTQSSPNNVYLQFTSSATTTNNFIRPQGIMDDGASYARSHDYTQAYGSQSGSNTNLGVFKANHVDRYGVDSQCYFRVSGVVNRLNKGGYHISLNPMGTRSFRNSGLIGAKWSNISKDKRPKTSADCFRIGDTEGDVHNDSGFVGSGTGGAKSGRDDGRFYDAIYASGQGGVTDLRMSAWDMSSKEEAAKVFQKVVNGTYRGLEKLVKTRVFGGVKPTDKGTFKGYAQVRFPAGTIDSTLPQYQKANEVKNGGHFVDSSGKVFVISSVSANSGGFDTVYLSTALGNHSDNIDITGNCYVLPIEELNLSVSGDFTMVDVLASPKGIIDTPDLAQGWIGRWIPFVNNGVDLTKVPLTRKVLGKQSKVNSNSLSFTSNGGDSWSNTTWGANSSVSDPSVITNEAVPHGSAISGNEVWVLSYTAYAKMTRPTSSEKRVFNGYEGVGYVFATEHYNDWTGVNLAESLIDKVLTNSTADYFMGEYLVTNLNGIFNGLLTWTSSDRDAPEHEQLKLEAPNNNSPAVKTLWYQTSENSQASLFLPYNELVWNDKPISSVKSYSAGSPERNALAGERWLLTGFSNGMLNAPIVIHKDLTINWSKGTFNDATVCNNEIRFAGGAPVDYHIFRGNIDGFGDDSKLRIKYGSDTYTNLNGDTCLCGTHELAIPYGFTKNKARTGEQLAGVDLYNEPTEASVFLCAEDGKCLH